MLKQGQTIRPHLPFLAHLAHWPPEQLRAGVPPQALEWAAEGGYFCGGVWVPTGDWREDYWLVIASPQQQAIDWHTANEWAASLTIAGHRDFTLPSIDELQLVRLNLRSLVRDEPYWSRRAGTNEATEAHVLDLADGLPACYSIHDLLHAVAVRRTPMRRPVT